MFKSEEIHKKDFGDQWPFVEDVATIIKYPDNILSIKINNTEYALNGKAQDHKGLPDPFKNNVITEGKSITTILNRGLYNL